MADDIMAVDERLARLEVAVASGFSDLGGRVGRLEARVEAGFSELGGRVGRLETGLSEVGARMNRLERRMDHLDDRVDTSNAKLDVSVEALSDKLQVVLERMDAHLRETRVWTEAIVKEHRADRLLIYAMLSDHRVRIQPLEQGAASSRGHAPSQEP